jgi:hypothetical protein
VQQHGGVGQQRRQKKRQEETKKEDIKKRMANVKEFQKRLRETHAKKYQHVRDSS